MMQDKTIRSTDIDALSCRNSCNQIGYFLPPDQAISLIIQSYASNLQYCQGYSNLSASRAVRKAFDKKFPIINRGTYIRTQAISNTIEQFVNHHKKCQIVSLGGGSDTRCFTYASPDVNYVELDFPETTKIKKLGILNSPVLKQAVGSTEDVVNPTSSLEFESMNSDLHTDYYHLIGADLRTLEDPPWLSFIDAKLPTLVLSECVLCYSTPLQNQQIILFWKSHLERMSILIYEPISLNDLFGRQMTENLAARGINLLTLNEYPTLKSKADFLAELGFTSVAVTDIAEIGGYGGLGSWFSAEELNRINRLELIDEVEEIRMLLMHYCLVYGLDFESVPGEWVLREGR